GLPRVIQTVCRSGRDGEVTGDPCRAAVLTVVWREAAVDRVTITEEELNALQWTALEYYIREENYCNGLIADKTQAGSPASIAGVGMALATLPLAAERAYLPRELT